jgi:hypothetical protein
MIFQILALVAGGVSAYGQVQAGKAQEEQMKQQAEQERLAAESRELQRREELNRALASNIAAQSMSGIAGEGTPASLAIESAKKAGLSEATIDLSEKLRQSALIRAGKTAKQTAYIEGASTLLRATAKAGEAGVFDKESYT